MLSWFSPRTPLPRLSLDPQKRAILRPFRDQDASVFASQIRATLAQNGTEGHMLTFPPNFTERQARARIRQTHKWLARDRGWSLALVHEGQLVGQVQLICTLPKQRKGEIAYWLVPQARGQGLARRGVATLISAARERWPLEQVEATVVPSNAASISLLEDLDFTKRELAPVRYRVQGHWRRRTADLLVFTRDAWNQV